MPAVFLSAVRIGKVHCSVSVGARGDREVCGVAGCHAGRLVYLLGCIYVLGQFTSHLLLSRGMRLLAVHRLLLENLVALLGVERFVAGAHCFLNYHATACVCTLLPQRGRIHLSASPPRINRMYFNYLIKHSIRITLDHGAMANYAR
ncbi:MAG TPA: hypothetical protein HPP54_10635 [Nitrospinae bacterium]|nr:hypothetical protein [Nitrospinota bacterium]